MNIWHRTVSIIAIGACLGIGLAAGSEEEIARPPQQATGSRDTRSVWDGVYTETQAMRGETQYAESCEHCHMSGLDGDAVEEVPALAWDAFMSRWSGKSVGELLEVMSRSMPKDAPGSLSRQAYGDLVAFVLSKNDIPPGRIPLDRDPERLKGIRIERKPGASR
jgi:hypothetical protein